MVYFTFTKVETKRNNSKKPCHKNILLEKSPQYLISLPTQKGIETGFVRPAMIFSSVFYPHFKFKPYD